MTKKENILMQEMIRVGKMTRIFPDGVTEVYEDVQIDGDDSEKTFLRGQNSSENSVHDCENPNALSAKSSAVIESVSTQSVVPQPVLQNEPLPTAITAERPLFSEAVDGYVIEKASGKRKPKPRSEDDYHYLRKIFIDLYTDQPIDTYDIRIAYDFRKVLMLLPIRHSRSKPWKTMSIKEILSDERLEDVEKISEKRADDLLTKIGAIFNNALKHNKVSRNIFRNISIDYSVQSYEPFTRKDLCDIFGPKLPVDKDWPSHYWVPLIGLFTGMRRSEIFFRTVEDIQNDNGVWFFDIHRRGSSDTKNSPSVRRVPIHSKLINLGFLGYVEKVRAARGERARLFSEYADYKGQAGNKFTEYFGSYLDSLEIIEKTKVFHSFRTTLINVLEAKDVSTPKIQRLIGHSTGTIVHDEYGGQSEVAVYRAEIEKLNFDVALLELPRWPY